MRGFTTAEKPCTLFWAVAKLTREELGARSAAVAAEDRVRFSMAFVHNELAAMF